MENALICMLCKTQDKNYFDKFGGSDFSCGHVVCWFCSSMHCSTCKEYQREKSEKDGSRSTDWKIAEEGCIICKSKEKLPCGAKYKDQMGIIPP